jgi:ribosomal protein S12 methylthiotransferase
MRRADTLRAVADLPRRLRRAIPGIALRTTCLVGFPGETEEHFRHLLAYVEEARFDHLGVFVFSPEEGTAAEKLPETPPAEVAAERRERLLRLQQQVVVARRRELAGTDATALLIRPEKPGRSDGAWIARLPRQAPDVDGITRVLGVPAGAHPGEFAPVRITGGRGCDLAARAGT